MLKCFVNHLVWLFTFSKEKAYLLRLGVSRGLLRAKGSISAGPGGPSFYSIYRTVSEEVVQNITDCSQTLCG